MRTLAVATVVALAGWACGAQPAGTSTPVSPTATPPNPANRFVGTWTGTLSYDSCLGGRDCRGVVGYVTTFEVRITRADTRVIGLWLPATPLEGTLDGDGWLTLAGRAAPIGELAGSDVTSLRLSVDGTDTLSGSAQLTTLPPINSERSELRYTATLSGGRRHPEAQAAPFSGRWAGYYQELSGSPRFFFDSFRELVLTLSQQGAQLHGTVDMTYVKGIPVEGRASGDEADLEGEYVDFRGTVVRLSGLHIRRDALGQLVGSYSLVHPQATASFDLVRVVRGGSAP